MKMRHLAVSVLAAGLLAGLAGCSDTSTDELTSDDGSTSPSSSPSPSSEGPPVLTEDSFAQEIAAAQAEAGSAHFEADVQGTGMSFDMSGDIEGIGDPSALSMAATTNIQGQPVEIRLIDRVFFLKNEQLAPAGKEWLKIDLTDPNDPMGQILDAANPSNFIAFLEGITKFEESGVETVDGVETRHYTVTVDTARMLKSNPIFRGQDASTLGLPAEVSSEVYVDSLNRPVQIQVDLGQTGTFDVHFSDYGKDVSVKAPDPRTVGEFSL